MSISSLQLYLQKIIEHLRADLGRAFRVKLRAEKVAMLDDGRERHAVASQRARVAVERCRVAVDEIRERARRDAREQRRRGHGLELVPAHLRDRQVRALWQPPDL